MATREEIFNKLRALGKTSATCLVGTFEKYDKDSQTITVQLANGLKIPGVRLKAAANKKKDYYAISVPREKSTVLIVQIGDKSEAGEYYLLASDEIETMEVKADKAKLTIDKTGILMVKGQTKFKLNKDGKIYLANNTANLYDAIERVINTVKTMSITIIGTAGANPITVTSAKPSISDVTLLEYAWNNELKMLLSKNE